MCVYTHAPFVCTPPLASYSVLIPGPSGQCQVLVTACVHSGVRVTVSPSTSGCNEVGCCPGADRLPVCLLSKEGPCVDAARQG